MRIGKLGSFAILVFLVVGFAIYDYWSSQNLEKKASEQRILLNVSVDQVQKLGLKIGTQQIEVERESKGWKMTKPVLDSGDSSGIEKFIEGIATESLQETVVEGEQIDWSNFGLDQPKGEINLTLNSGETHRFVIGQRKNYQGDAYLRKDDEKKVVIASSTWFSKLEKTALDFRDRRLMRRSNADTDNIFFEKGGQKFQLSKKEGQWSLTQNPNWRIDQNKVRELLAQLNSTEVLEFVAEGDAKPEELKKWGLAPGLFRITVGSSAERELKPWTADFSPGSDKVSRVRVSDPEVVFKIAPSELGKFQILTADSFRDRSEPFQFDRAKVRKIEVRLGKQNFQFKPDDEKGQKLISQLEKMTIADFSAPAKSQFEQEIDLQDESGQTVFSSSWGDLRTAKDEKGSQQSVFTAQAQGYPQKFSVSASDVNSMNLNDLVGGLKSNLNNELKSDLKSDPSKKESAQ